MSTAEGRETLSRRRGPYRDLSHLTPEEKHTDRLEQNRVWKRDHPERARDLARGKHDRLKHEVFAAYGGQCVCCGEPDLHFLTIDHIRGVPGRHRHPSGRRISGTAFLALLKREGYPTDCRCLCWNCNCARAYYGFCPHEPHTEADRRYA